MTPLTWLHNTLFRPKARKPARYSDSFQAELFVDRLEERRVLADPTNTVPGAVMVDEDLPLAFTGGNLISVADSDGDLDNTALTVTSGTLTVTLMGTATISSGANGSAMLTISGSQLDINDTLATLVYQGTMDFNGMDTLTVVSTDMTPGTDTDMVAITVNAVNDAPVLANTAVTLNAVSEDAGAPVGAVGTLVSSLVDFPGGGGQDNVTDVDTGAVTGIAITDADATNGTWWYTIDGGTNWLALGAVTNTSARVLAADANTRIYFEPNADFNGTVDPAITFRAWDQTDLTANGTAGVDTSTNGGVTAFSSATDTASQAVTAVNDAPVLADTLVTLNPVAEDAGAPAGAVGTLVTSIVDFAGGGGQNNVTDVDAGAVTGIAITAADATNGTWWYTIDGGTNWLALGAVTNTSARVLAADANTRIYFEPNADFNGTVDPAITFRAWDQSDLTANGTAGVDTSTNGGTTAFSSATDTASQAVTAVNDAPVLADTLVTLNPVAEDAGAPAGAVGTLVTSIVDFAGGGGQNNVTDVDAGAVTGIAITAADATNGTWFYTIDGGTNWLALGAVTNTSARVLAADADTRIYFQPNADFNGTVDPAITFRAWDQSDLTANGTAGVDTSTNGGTTAFSSATDTASQAVTAVNDAPVLADTVVTLNAVAEDAPAPVGAVGTLVTSIVDFAGGGGQNNVTDVDAAAVTGIAITAADATNGTWWYTIDGGTNWLALGAVTNTSARVLAADANTRIYFEPNADFTGTVDPAITFRAWDQTDGSANGDAGVDTSTNGGTTAFSAATDTASQAVSAVNDAPVLDNTGAMTLTAITEDDTMNAGDLVSAIIASAGGDRIMDADAGAIEGIAITATAVNTGSGTWQFSIDNGGSWTDIGAVAANSALLLRATDRVRFVPDAMNAATGTITFHAWDQTGATAGQQGTKQDASTTGTTTPYSTATETADITATAVNDAPVLDNAGAMTLTTITEDDTTNGGDLVSAIIASAGGDRITDVDNGAVEGIAITATAVNTGAGTWQFSTDGGTVWTDIGAVAGNSALLLRATDRVRFVPDAMNAATGTITFHAWDQTGATAGQQGTKVDASTTGTTTPYSTATETADVTVTAVNDAPVLDNTGAMTLTTITEDDTMNAGDLVSAIIASAGGDRITDVDNGAIEGIAITATAVNTGAGTWQFSTDGGTVWTDIGAVAGNSALLLRATDRVRFVPDAMNAATGTITFRAWDQSGATAGQQGTKVDASTNGTTTPFSTATETADITVTAVNDAPVLDNTGSMTLTTITEDDTMNAGDLVSAIIASAGGDRITDVDNGAIEGIAITATAVTTGAGTWQFSIDNGGSWTDIGAVAGNSALLLRATDRVRFVPDAMNAATGTITFRAWDQTGATAGQQGTKVDASTNGSTTPFSAATETADITVTAVNDAPVLDNTGTMTLTTITEDDTANAGDLVSAIIASAGGDRITDVDNGAVEGIAITATAVNTGTGTWQFSTDGGGTWTDIGAVSDNSALLLRATDRVRFVPDAMNGATGTITFRAWDQTGATAGQQGTKVDASTNGTTTPFSTATETADITVTDVNDAPVLDNTGTMSLTSITEDNTANTGDLVSAIIASAGGDRITDVDNGAVEGIAITGLTTAPGQTGVWQFSTDNGGTWTDIGAVSDTSALTLRSNDRVRFLPDTQNGGTMTVTFRAWDQTGATAGQQGTKIDVSTNGGTTPASTAMETAQIVVTELNDTPTATSITLTTTDEDAFAAFVSAFFTFLGADVDLRDPMGNPEALTYTATGFTVTLPGPLDASVFKPDFDFTVDFTSINGQFQIQPQSFAFLPQNMTAFQRLAQGEQATLSFMYTATDTAGASATANVTLVVNGVNDNPTVAVQPVAPINEGETAQLTVIAREFDFSDQSQPHVLTATWEGAAVTMTNVPTSQVQNVDGLRRTFVITHQYLDDPNGLPDVFTVPISVVDLFNGTGNAVAGVRVNNLAPAFVQIILQDVGSDSISRITGTVSDAGVLDQIIIHINWNDPFGSNGDPLTELVTVQTVTLVGGQGTFMAEHRYSAGQTPDINPDTTRLRITLTADDQDGGVVRADVRAQVAGTGLGGIPFDVTPETPQFNFEIASVQSELPVVQSVAELVQLLEFQLGRTGPSQGGTEQLVLQAVDPNGNIKGKEIAIGRENERPEDVLQRLNEIFNELPDDQYRIFLKREDGTKRLVLNVILRRHKQIDPDELKKTGPAEVIVSPKKFPGQKLDAGEAHGQPQGPKLNRPQLPDRDESAKPVVAPKPGLRKDDAGSRLQDDSGASLPNPVPGVHPETDPDPRTRSSVTAVAATVAIWAGADGLRRWRQRIDHQMALWGDDGFLQRKRRLARSRTAAEAAGPHQSR